MRASTIIPIALGLVLSLGAGFMVFSWMQGSQKRQEVQAPKTVEVVVSAQQIAKGTKLTETHLKKTSFLPESVPAGTFAETAALIGRVVATPIEQGEMLTAGRLLDDTVQYGGVSTLISPGMRAIAVKGNQILGIAGFIRPGNRVDVLVTIDDERRTDDKAVTKTVLENVRVIATGTELEQKGDDKETSSVDVYTLEMAPQDTEKLALAATRGTLHFSLRNPADAEAITTRGTDVPDTLASLSPPKPKTKAAAKKPETKVEVITGTNRQIMRFAQ
ncbi:MAG: Flp pilus assembly protein CpaB [Halodesulfovibrio sp.]